MPVNTAALKTFAPAMRRQLLEAVGRKLDLLLTSQTPDTLSTYAKQIGELREQEAENREQLLERVAYTWFNRLCALRYLDARSWHPFGCKVLMPAAEGETQPELLKLMRAGNLPADLQGHTDQGRLHGLLDGQIQTAIAGADPQGEVYRQLVLAVCRCYHELLPNLFEGLDDASELLLPDDLLSDGSIVGAFRKEITDDDCQDVESLGWLYQFYIAEKKDEVMARKKAVPTEDIPAVTQLFTPHWIVRYLVENSLGRLWLLNRPGSKLREQMPYYIEGDAETDFLAINKPEEIKLLDPACGSGHMLTYAFDLLVLIYEEEGYSPIEIPSLILKHNLYGLEICPRAAQLAELALVFKAREQSRRFFQSEQLVRPQIIELQDIQLEDGELNEYIEALNLGEQFNPSLFQLLRQFEEAKNFGSLIRPCIDERDIANFHLSIKAKEHENQLLLGETHLKVLRVLEQAEALTQRYHTVVANPPYLGGGGMNSLAKNFAKKNFPDSRMDLFAMFIERALALAFKDGFAALVTMQTWMFLSSYEALREKLLTNTSLVALIQIGFNSFPEMNSKVARACAFVSRNAFQNQKGSFINLNNAPQSADKEAVFFERIQADHIFKANAEAFRKIPGSPIAYWLSASTFAAFENGRKLGDLGDVKTGMSTTDNERFVRFWHEVNISSSTMKGGGKWVPYNKGGGFRKWYGNLTNVVNWADDGREIKAWVVDNPNDPDTTHWSRRIFNTEYFYKPCVTWGDISSGPISVRHLDCQAISDSVGIGFYASEPGAETLVLQLLNSIVTTLFTDILCPTVHFNPGAMVQIPVLAQGFTDLSYSLVSTARADWDNFETSWDFHDQPLLRPELNGATLEASWRNWEEHSTTAIRRMQELETENNRLFIAAYGLEGELQPEVPEEQITLARAEPRKDLAAFLSYATGCMMGRYSLDHPGLIIADSHASQAEQLAAYEGTVGKPLSEVQFKPDPDGIIPVLDGEWFEDDIVARTREFLAVTFPESSVAENLRFIEESLGKDIRKYFCSEFYKDHLQTYKKRPIYWLVQSPKKGFSCLIYLHRYTKDTLNQVLNNYFRPYLLKLEAHLAKLGIDQLDDSLTARERTAARKEAEKITKVLKECEAWEQDSLLPLAQQRIELDLDDGVKVNYLKLQDVLAPIPGLAAKED